VNERINVATSSQFRVTKNETAILPF
jgi:hypothetical protein